MRLAADLMDAGANLFESYQHTMLDRSFAAARYWGAGLTSLERDGRMVWASLRLTDRKAVGYPGRDDADLINVVSTITETDISLIFVEQTDGRVKVSWRAKPGFDVSKVALQFGGGGHTAAAGADIAGEFHEVQQAVLKATRLLV
jgi:phosphoesterase RecJ-like protein